MVGSYTYNLTSNLLNDLRLSFTQEDVAFASPGFNAGKSQAELPPTLVSLIRLLTSRAALPKPELMILTVWRIR
ncbi:MAG: hypothetical protein WKF71_03540 [Pyrinomonadaceae bacterium]